MGLEATARHVIGGVTVDRTSKVIVARNVTALTTRGETQAEFFHDPIKSRDVVLAAREIGLPVLMTTREVPVGIPKPGAASSLAVLRDIWDASPKMVVKVLF